MLAVAVAFSLLGTLGLLADPLAQDVAARLQPPSAAHPFGTDQFGRDILSRCAAGLATSLAVAFGAVGAAAVVGTAVGVFASWTGRWVDRLVALTTDVLFAFPAIILALVIASALGGGAVNTTVAIAIVYLPIFIRTATTSAASVLSTDYMQATRVLRLRVWSAVFRHLLPVIGSVVLIQVAVRLSTAVITEASLSFLGLGTQPPYPSLGLMVSESRTLGGIAWWALVAPSAVLVFTILAMNLAGDAGRDALDPHKKLD